MLDDLLVEHVGPKYCSWLNDPEVMRFTEARFRTHTINSIRSFVQKTNDSVTDHVWRILCSGHHVGNVKLAGINKLHRRASLSILIGDRDVWGHGVATRAIQLATAKSFEKYNLFKIFAGIYATNSASIKAFQKAGYVLEATLRCHRCLDDQMIDEVLMAYFQHQLIESVEC